MSTTEKPVIVLVHGAFAESASWNGVIRNLHGRGYRSVAVANPLRGLDGDATYVRDVINGLGGPVVLVGHSYGGMVITEAAAGLASVQSLVYVGAFAPETGESAFELSGKFPGSSLGAALVSYPVSTGGDEFRIDPAKFHFQFCADLGAEEAGLMGATQRPVTERALTDGLSTATPAWRTTPSWFVHGERDLNIPAEALRFMAERASSRGTREVAGASHAVGASRPDEVAAVILEAAGEKA
ncbi:pimeloyl-ACP methyl ester carboxylesterase [Actinocorallia herbida]|uniref:Pimeloyl-ACP methyl ester carboxylesterase n=1 Tax=Actinocorallia herbida TaxID=58109 RepID=A0A3N1CVR1_9ACTN|nr:alpha/beta hydrolase [Actinocorallia herbida]ROO85377.1 pimeloyl-ACP methyl ester carboxylesterase [Actinocorallia herbida]